MSNRFGYALMSVTVAAWAGALSWGWVTSGPVEYRQGAPRDTQPLVLAFMEGAQRSGGIVGDDDDNGTQDIREGTELGERDPFFERVMRALAPSPTPSYDSDRMREGAPREFRGGCTCASDGDHGR